MLVLFSFDDFIDAAVQTVDTLIILFNALIYNFISFLYQIFIAISSAQLFTNDQYQTIARNLYIVIGVVSLFLIAYALLRAIINPDNLSKGEYSVGKIVPNVLKVIVLIAFTPTLFNFAYNMQSVIVSQNVIPKIILGNTYSDGVAKTSNGTSFSYKEAGNDMANEAFNAFFSPVDGLEPKDVESKYCQFTTCNGLKTESGFDSHGKKLAEAYTLEDAQKWVREGKEDFTVYANFGRQIHAEEAEIEYNGIFQLITGIMIIYVLLNFCIDLGVRAVKFGYYQLIAPIPILTIMIPGQNKIFNNWLKSTISTFLDIFIRIAIIFFGILVIKMLPSIGDEAWSTSLFETNRTIQGFARAFLIVGILIFVKQAPKLLSDLFGISGSGFKLGIKDKLGEMAGIGGATKDTLSGVEGGITGGLGAAWTAKRNGLSSKDGFKYGWSNGWKGKGNQFNAQRQGIYKNAMDGDGKAAMFGSGRALFDKMGAQINKDTKNAYREQNFQRLLKYEKTPEFEEEYNKIYSTKTAEISGEITRVEGERQKREDSYSTEINSINSRIATAEAAETLLKTKQAEYDAKAQEFENNKRYNREALQMEYDRAGERGDSVAQLAAATRLQQLNDSKYENPQLAREIADLRRSSDNLNTLKAQLQEVNESHKNDQRLAEYDKNLETLHNDLSKLADEKDYFYSTGKYEGLSRSYDTEKKRKEFFALKEARSSFERTHADYHDVNRTHASNLSEESSAAYLSSKEGQQQTAVFKAAMKGMNNGGGSSGNSGNKK